MVDRQLVLGNLILTLEKLGFTDQKIKEIISVSDYFWDVTLDEEYLNKVEQWNKQNPY